MPAPRTTLSAMALAVACLAAGTATTATALTVREAPADAQADSTRTASAITELSAEEVSTGASARVKVTGRLVEGSTLTFPLARIPLTVHVTDTAAATPASCHARTTDRGTFSCSVAVTAGTTRSVKAAFAGNELFAPCTSTTSIGSTDEAALPTDPLLPDTTASVPDAAATPAATPAAATTPDDSTPASTPTAPAAPTPPELPTAPPNGSSGLTLS
ncbi:hypothetical protein ABZV77_23935 [Streptomyces sp. NPDC004732]|uniref:hypothetical protein n=1 Tax=Streptomyces sp. NPDC004732 TaxID=3154290 RepID=UPI0033A9EAB8